MEVSKRDGILFREIISAYHPDFGKVKNLKKSLLCSTMLDTSPLFNILDNPSIFNCSKLLEQTIAAVGNLKVVDEPTHDFDDYSDAKLFSSRPGKNSWHSILSVTSHRIPKDGREKEMKAGPLRVVCVNEMKDHCDFFFIPKEDGWEDLVDYERGEIRVCYRRKTDNYGDIEDFRIRSFYEMCNKKV